MYTHTQKLKMKNKKIQKVDENNFNLKYIQI